MAPKEAGEWDTIVFSDWLLLVALCLRSEKVMNTKKYLH
jgi:hypothetical protein